jgi:hypothetical protein
MVSKIAADKAGESQERLFGVNDRDNESLAKRIII